MPKDKHKKSSQYFDDLYDLEKEARDLYHGFLKDLKDKYARKIIRGIMEDEEKHMKIAKNIRAMLLEGEKKR
jgi:rubrerythrin